MQVDWGTLLGITGANLFVVVLVGWIIRRLFERWLDKDVEKYKSDLEQERNERLHQLEKKLEDYRAELQSKAGLQDRIRDEILSWANPILGSVEKLEGRLHNVLDKKENGWKVLKKGYTGGDRWSIDYDYFMKSTLYAFAVYFFWIERLRAFMSFELFQTHAVKDEFFEAISAVSRALGEYPPKTYRCRGTDYQVFRYQQQAIGEAMRVPSTDGKPTEECIGYHDFLMDYKQESVIAERLLPLRRLLENITPEDTCRWKRLKATKETLRDLDRLCRRLLDTSRKS